MFSLTELSFADSDDDTRSNSRKKMRAYFSAVFSTMKGLNSRPSHMMSDMEYSEADIPDLDYFKEKSVFDLNQDWFLKAFLIRVRPSFGFDLPGTWSLKIVPEAEVYWMQPK